MPATLNLACSKLGANRLNMIKKFKNRADWQRLWKAPKNKFPFKWGDCWNHSSQYQVDDFASEVGFFIDVLGFPTNAFGPDFAMFMSPKREFFSVIPTPKGEKSTPPDAFRLQFMIDNIEKTAVELERRGIKFEERPAPYGGEGSPMFTGYFRTPHGIPVDLWGLVKQKKEKS